MTESLDGNSFSGHLLCYGKGANPEYSTVSCPVLPGTPFHCRHHSDAEILLAGGFSAIHPDSPFPLSPTLQLNGDLTTTDNNDLAAIGRAELVRSNSQSFRSYILEPDARVAVLGAEARALDAFVDRYGGVLQIEPLLIKGFDPNFSTIINLEISRRKNPYRLSFMVKQPVDVNKCTYCGACGAICPEQCLSEQLFLNFDRCTLCNKCVEICPRAAIDLHAVEKREFEVPSILLLEGVQIDLPRQTEGIYSENNLGPLFDSIYTAEVEKVVSWDHSICQYSRKLDAGCNACLTACRYNAVSQDRDGVHINHLQCTECGACLASCPTGALQYARFTDADFVEYFRTVTIPAGGTVVMGDEEDLHKFWWNNEKSRYTSVFFLEYPQPGGISSMHLLLLYAMGASRIVILGENAKENSAVKLEIELVNSVITALYDSNDPVLFLQQNELKDALMRPGDSSPPASLYHNFSFTNRREKLADILSFLYRQGKTEDIRLTGPAAAKFGEVLCDTKKCTLCNACVGECRIAALTAGNNDFTLTQLPILCVQCGACVDLCPENALSLRPGLTLDVDFFDSTLLARAEPVKCRQCGKIFGTRQSLAKVMAVLAQKNILDGGDDLLNYCDTCRVVQLFESKAK